MCAIEGKKQLQFVDSSNFICAGRLFLAMFNFAINSQSKTEST